MPGKNKALYGLTIYIKSDLLILWPKLPSERFLLNSYILLTKRPYFSFKNTFIVVYLTIKMERKMGKSNKSKIVAISVALSLIPALTFAESKYSTTKGVSAKVEAKKNDVDLQIDALNKIDIIKVTGIVRTPPSSDYAVTSSRENAARKQKLKSLVSQAKKISLTKEEQKLVNNSYFQKKNSPLYSDKYNVDKNLKALNALNIVKTSGIVVTPPSSDYAITSTKENVARKIKLAKLLSIAKKL